MTPDFRVEWIDDVTSRLVSVFGEVDLASVGGLRAALECEQPRLVMDLRHVTFMDLSGLECLIEAVGKHKVVLVTSPMVDRLLELTATGQLFEINKGV
ncbi:MAG: STAS domain-containing protein [Acidimicrobiia bacterium]